MSDLDIGKASTTTLRTSVKDYSVQAQHLDNTGASQEEVWYDFPKAPQQLGYYKTIPELKKAIDALAIWTCGKGLETDSLTQVMLERLRGWGEDSYQSIFENLIVQKKIFGDAFAEIIEDDEVDLILNLKPLYPGDMRVVVNRQGMIVRYEQRNSIPGGVPRILKPDQVLHLCNDRIGNEIHGVSVIDACQWVIDARNEALADTRKIMHRDLAMGVLYIDTDNTTKREAIIAQYGDAVKNGEVLVLPKGTAELGDSPVRNHEDRLAFIQYLENFFYQAVGVPRVIASSQEYSEAASKVGYLTFEPIYTREQTLLEQDLWNQLDIRVKFNRPPSLGGIMASSESKNTGQTGFQPSDTQVSAGRVE